MFKLSGFERGWLATLFCYRYMCLRQFSFAIASFLCGGTQSSYARLIDGTSWCAMVTCFLFCTYQKDFTMLDNTRNNMHLVRKIYKKVRQLCRGVFPFLTSWYMFSSDRSTLKPILESTAEMNQYSEECTMRANIAWWGGMWDGKILLGVQQNQGFFSMDCDTNSITYFHDSTEL